MKKILVAALLMIGVANTAFAAEATGKCEIKNNPILARRGAITLAVRDLATQLGTNQVRYQVVEERGLILDGVSYYEVKIKDAQ